jgi:CopG family nickel-responsive transcriptional regulator
LINQEIRLEYACSLGNTFWIISVNEKVLIFFYCVTLFNEGYFIMSGKGVSRFGVSAPPELLTEFDETIARMGYDRSKALRLAMRDFLTEYKWKHKEEGAVAGTFTIIYDHEVKGLEESLTDTQHLNRNIINSTLHIHLDERNCLLVITVKGEVKAIRDLARELMSKRGIKQFKLTVVS